MVGLIGRKLGMTQVFSEKGLAIPVTVLEAGPCPVVQVKTPEKDGYSAIQLGFDEVPEKHAARKVNRPERGHLAKHGAKALRRIREFIVDAGHDMASGTLLTVEQFTVGQRVDVVGRSKGRGFAGVVRRHHFHGGSETHGSKTGDLPGSIGSSAWPSHVWKGKKLPGHMGDKRRSAINLEVVRIDLDRNLILVRGNVPGAPNSWVEIRPAYKAIRTAAKVQARATGGTAKKGK